MSVDKLSRATGFKSLLCAVDFGPQSKAALKRAMELARTSGGHVTCLSVEDPLLGQGAAAVGYDTAKLRESTVAQLRRLVARAAASAGVSAEQYETATVVGEPAAAIVAFARKISADLIVMGTNARHGTTKLFFGSTAQAVLRRAPSAVLVIPGKRRSLPGAKAFAGAMLGAIDLGTDDREDASRLSRAAARLGMPLTLLHVVPATPAPAWFAARLANHDRARVLAAEARLSALAKSVKADRKVVLGRPALEIPRVATNTNAATIALVLRRGRGLFAPRQGSTTYQVLSTADIPVLALAKE